MDEGVLTNQSLMLQDGSITEETVPTLFLFPGACIYNLMGKFPLAGFPGRVTTRTAMRVHFVHWHVLDTMVILEEGNSPHPRCAQSNMIVPWQALNGRHPGTAQCKNVVEQKRRRLGEAETRESTERSFEAYLLVPD